MPRTPSIRYFASRQAYYTQYQAKQHLLAAGPKDEPDGPTYKAAVLRFSQLMHVGQLERGEDNIVVSTLIVRYYHHVDREGRARTLHLARTLLDPAIAEFGHVKIKELKPIVVADWLAKMGARPRNGRRKPWNSSTRNTALGVLSRAFNWCKEQGIITRNPVAGMKKDEKLVRGKEVVLPEPLQDLLIAAASPALAKFLRMLRGTGARPGETINADCKHYHRTIAALIFPWNPPPGEYRWKNAKKTKRDRTIYLSPELQQLVEAEIAARGGRGRIFLSPQGKHWTNFNFANCMMKRLARRKEVQRWCAYNNFDARKIMGYAFRHSYISRMLSQGCPIKLLADLCGTSVTEIEQTYSHVHEDHAAMRRLLLQFSSGAPVPTEPESAGSHP